MKFTKRMQSNLDTTLSDLYRRLEAVEQRERSHAHGVTITPDEVSRRLHPVAMAANDARNVANQASLDAGQALEAATTGAQIADGALKFAHEHTPQSLHNPLERPRAQDRYVLHTLDVGTGWHGHGDNMGQHRHAWGHLPHDKLAHAPLDQSTIEHRQLTPLVPPRMPGWFRRLHRAG